MHLYNSINMYKDSFYCNEIAFLLHEMHEFVNELHENSFMQFIITKKMLM